MSDIAPAPSSAPATPFWRRPRNWFVALGLALLAGGGIYYSRTQTEAAQPGAGESGKAAAAGGGKRQPPYGNRPVPVVAVPARVGEMAVNISGLGNAIPRNTVTVKSRVDGQLMKLGFTEGQMVKAGTLLAEIDPRPFQVVLTQAEGQLAKDQALLQNAKLDLERYKTLFAQDSIAKQQLDTQAALVRQYEGTVKSDQGQVDSARLQLTYCRVSAPVAGRVGLRQVDPGNIIHASDSTGIVTITQVQPMTVVFTLPEDSIPRLMQRLAKGEKLAVSAFDREQKNKLAEGFLLSADNQIDATTGTLKLKAQFANDDLALFPNQFVYVRLTLDKRKDAILIPSSAIQRNKQNGAFVYVVQDDQTVAVRSVKLGPAEGEITAIDEGLAAGEKVVSDGTDKLRDGAKVEAQAPDARNAGAGGKGSRRGNGEGKRPDAAAAGASKPADTQAPQAAAAPSETAKATAHPATAPEAVSQTPSPAAPANSEARPKQWDPEKAAEWRKRRGLE